MPVTLFPFIVIFQSTLPVGGATWLEEDLADEEKHFNPRSPWGERQISLDTLPFRTSFQSTLPVGGATSPTKLRFFLCGISIHAPRGGSDFPF